VCGRPRRSSVANSGLNHSGCSYRTPIIVRSHGLQPSAGWLLSGHTLAGRQ
jgi:hypothetical protein